MIRRQILCRKKKSFKGNGFEYQQTNTLGSFSGIEYRYRNTEGKSLRKVGEVLAKRDEAGRYRRLKLEEVGQKVGTKLLREPPM